ncbi:DUF31 family putative serine protease [Malacoplasma muris]|uniref:DUF31 family putative serine protease n=1 Tax=Malacoplasma muris TaxID=2119 RepID=UPI00398EF34E
MKIKNKIWHVASILAVSPILVFATSCKTNSNVNSNNVENNNSSVNTNDKTDVTNYVNSLKPAFKGNTSDYKVSYFTNEQKIIENFDGLPKSHGSIEVQFVDAKEGTNSQTLEVRYIISKNDYSYLYSFSTTGFKAVDKINDIKIVEDFINKLNPTIKSDKVSSLNTIIASSIKTQNQVNALFDGLPTNNGTIVVEFVVSTEVKSGTLEVKYIISSNSYSKPYTFSKDGFKVGEANISDKNSVLNYQNSLNPSVRSGKDKSNTLVETLNNESSVKEFYDNLPMNNNSYGVVTEFVSSIDKGNGNIEIKFLLTKNDYSSLYVFNDSNFKINPLTDAKNYIDNYVKQINITLKDDKVDQIKNTYASSINTEGKLNSWFTGLPTTIPLGNDRRICQLISAVPSTYDSSILVLTYIMERLSYKTTISFEISGFKPLDTNHDSSLSNFKDFSQNNTFRLRFGVQDGKYFTEGTAWSWHVVDKNANNFDWYLMTNLHVVDNVVADISGNWNNGNINVGALRTYYQNNYVSTFPISDSKEPFQLVSYSNNNTAQAIINVNPKIGLNESSPNYIPNAPNVVDKTHVKSIKIIHDFNNDNIELFSKTTNGTSKNYNLDMAIVKISLSFGANTDYLNPNYVKKPIYQKFLNLNKQAKNVDSNNGINISGIPYNSSKPKETKIVNFNSISNVNPRYEYSNLLYNSSVLSDLRGPYYYLTLPENKFQLTGGASGSAVYQLEDPYNYVDYDKIIPVGIYWGHDSNRNGLYQSPDNTMPSFLPFVFNGSNNDDAHYNIWENFYNSFSVIQNL